MNFGLPETQQALKNTARKFLAAECPIAEVRRLMETGTAYDAALWRKLADQGFTGILFSEEYGGSGMGAVEMAVLFEEMGRALLPGPFLSTIFAGAVIDKTADRNQQDRLLSPICAGDARATVALLEDSASWSPEAVTLRAAAKGDGYALYGRKLFVADVGTADTLITVARLNGELAVFAVPSASQGLNNSPMPSLDATRKLYEVTFETVPVLADGLLAVGQPAISGLKEAMDIATVAIVAEMLGGMQRLLEITVEYAKTRKQFGKPIGSFQAVQHQCADMLLMTESTRSAVYYAAYAVNERIPEASTAVSVAKSYAGDAYREVGNRAIQVHGGMGFTWENDCHLFYRRAKASETAFGDAIFHRERIAKLVLDAQPVRREEAAAIA